MRSFAEWLAVVALSMLLGIGFAALRITRWNHPSNYLKNGVWRAHREAQMQGDPLTVAQLAMYALFVLKSEEVVYFLADSDDEGRPLRAECSYEISGKGIDARYWSVTLYDAERMLLVDNAPKRHAFSRHNTPLDEKGELHVRMQPDQPMDGVWLPTGKTAQALRLCLRLYQPSAALRGSLETFAAPRIKRAGECAPRAGAL